MAWGFGKRGYGAVRVQRMLQSNNASQRIANIVGTVRTLGAGAGWKALLGQTEHVRGLGMAFGTKLLYFAAYKSSCPGPRPLILDARVRRAAVKYGIPIPAKGRVVGSAYDCYLACAKKWANTPSWKQTPETVEFALFCLG
jgi:hypothetical protein